MHIFPISLADAAAYTKIKIKTENADKARTCTWLPLAERKNKKK